MYDVRTGQLYNRLQLNQGFLSTRLIDSGVFSLAGRDVTASASVRDLGAYFDLSTSHEYDITSCQPCRQQITLSSTSYRIPDGHHTRQQLHDYCSSLPDTS